MNTFNETRSAIRDLAGCYAYLGKLDCVAAGHSANLTHLDANPSTISVAIPTLRSMQRSLIMFI